MGSWYYIIIYFISLSVAQLQYSVAENWCSSDLNRDPMVYWLPLESEVRVRQLVYMVVMDVGPHITPTRTLGWHQTL